MSKYFSASEQSCPHCGRNFMDKGFMEAMDKLREMWGKPMICTSMYRCDVHNKAIGGAVNSMHLRGKAADIACTSPADRYQLLKLIYAHGGFNGIEVGPYHIHIDQRKTLPVAMVLDSNKQIF